VVLSGRQRELADLNFDSAVGEPRCHYARQCCAALRAHPPDRRALGGVASALDLFHFS
jgi:hypothetical protein